MKKILVIADGLFTKEKLLSPEVAEKFKALEEFGYTYDVATDTSFFRGDGKPTEFIRKIESEGPEWVEPDQEVMDKIKDADVIMAHFSGVNRKMIESCEKLELISVMRSGVENVNLQAATDNKVVVLNAPGRVSEPVADFAVGLILAEARDICRANLKSTGGIWPAFDRNDSANATLRNHTVGIVGFGIIGQKVAMRLKPFGVKMVAYDPYPNPEKAEKLGVKLVSLDELCKVADYVTIHARLSPESEGMFGEKQFDLMKPSAILVNTARAGLVDEPALVKALQEKKIRSAALDVFIEEPLPEGHPLLALDNVTLTPHRAGATSDNMELTLDTTIGQLVAYFSGVDAPRPMN